MSQKDAEAGRVAELLKGFAYPALAVFFVNGIINFVKSLRFDFSFSGFLDASWNFLHDLFLMGVVYVCLLASSHVIQLLLEIKSNTKKET